MGSKQEGRAPKRAGKGAVPGRVPRPKARPAPDLSRSQLFTPAWLARRMARWVREFLVGVDDGLVLEPSCGDGALIDGLVQEGVALERIHAIEADARLMRHARERFGVSADSETFRVGNFFALSSRMLPDSYRVAIMNPPYEHNQHLAFVLRALEVAPIVVGVFPVDFEFTQERDARLWAMHGAVIRRARLPERVRFTGKGGQYEHVVLAITRRRWPRARGEVCRVMEETWRSDDPCPSPFINGTAVTVDEGIRRNAITSAEAP